MSSFLGRYLWRLLFWVAVVTLIRFALLKLLGIRLRADAYVLALVLAISSAADHRIKAGRGQFNVAELAIASLIVSLAYFCVTVAVRLLNFHLVGFDDGLSVASFENQDALLLAGQFMLGFTFLLALILIPITIILKQRGWC